MHLDGSHQVIKGFTNPGTTEHLFFYFSDMLLTKILKNEFQTFAIYSTQFFLSQPFSLDCEGILHLHPFPASLQCGYKLSFCFVSTELSCFLRVLDNVQQLCPKHYSVICILGVSTYSSRSSSILFQCHLLILRCVDVKQWYI